MTEIISETSSISILDYGCGNGLQYRDEKFHHSWGEKVPALYDPLTGVGKRPTTQFDGVLCLDLLGRIDPARREAVCKDLVACATRFLFVVVPRGIAVDFTVRDGCRLEIREN